MSGCLRVIIWRNQNSNTESKVKIYKTSVRSVVTYANDSKADTKKIRQMMRAVEMKAIGAIQGKTLLVRARNKNLRAQSGIQDVAK